MFSDRFCPPSLFPFDLLGSPLETGRFRGKEAPEQLGTRTTAGYLLAWRQTLFHLHLLCYCQHKAGVVNRLASGTRTADVGLLHNQSDGLGVTALPRSNVTAAVSSRLMMPPVLHFLSFCVTIQLCVWL